MKWNIWLEKSTKAVCILGSIISISYSGVQADTPEEKGYEIVARSDRSDKGFIDSAVDIKMLLRNKAGKESTRFLNLKTLEVQNENLGDKSLIVFDRPADIKGTALLSHAKILDSDDQWLYMPALKRVKRISSANKSGPFVGSEFAFEDFTGLELNKYSYKYLRGEELDGLLCDVIERYPRYADSGYTKQVTWIDQDVFQVRKIDYYNRRGDLLKTLNLESYKKYGNGYWRPNKMIMVNHQTGKRTDMLFSNYSFKNGLNEQAFQKSVLRHLR